MYKLILLLFVAIFVFSSFAQNPKKSDKENVSLEYHHDSSDLLCVLSCSETEIVSFDKILKLTRNDAASSIDGKDACFDEMFTQVVSSIDNMDKDEKKLDCCIFKKFCNDTTDAKHQMYTLTWDSSFDCYGAIVSVSAIRERCDLLTK